MGFAPLAHWTRPKEGEEEQRHAGNSDTNPRKPRWRQAHKPDMKKIICRFLRINPLKNRLAFPVGCTTKKKNKPGVRTTSDTKSISHEPLQSQKYPLARPAGGAGRPERQERAGDVSEGWEINKSARSLRFGISVYHGIPFIPG
ncbi:hypothetical protein SKAU_G00013510 [Synaphobranchus kaupii]|uniref:Uncharacterized protein n=1 Tax=Synaphobranchus kaupii TaxID=118154 RepID=A0A9Q1GBG1_SYNKA|nr:hypothetical protein SKAU_G00013510 [Synaphobranchus kaupii]